VNHPPEPAADPVRLRRARAARAAELGQRTGYALFLLAVVLFAAGLASDFPAWAATGVVAALITGSVVLAPSIVIGYAVRAAEREDRERGL
jgi:hypothetical protein